jgi:hypothetical protein
LTTIGKQYGISATDIAKANHIANPDMVYPNDILQIPVPPNKQNPPDPSTTQTQLQPPPPPAQNVDDAHKQVDAAQNALNVFKGKGSPAQLKQLQQNLTDAQNNLQAQTVIASAKAQTDPGKALTTLNQGYASANPNVKQRILANSDAQAIIKNVATQATAPLGKVDPGTNDFYSAIFGLRQSLQNLDQSTAHLDPTIAAAVVNQALPQVEQFNTDYAAHHHGQSLTADVLHTGPSTIDSVMSLSGHIAGTTQGDQDVARLAKLGFWDNNSVSNALYGGASAAYPAAIVAQIKASGQDPTNVLSIIQQGVRADQQRVDGDVNALAEHNRELNWLVQNLGSSMTPAQLNAAISDYENKDGGKWKSDDEKLVQKLTSDGATLTQNLKTLNTLAQQNPETAQTLKINDTLTAVLNDAKANTGTTLAISQNPNLVSDAQGKSLLDIASSLKLSDQGRKALQIAGSLAIRDKIAGALSGVDWSSPNALSQARTALDELKSPYYQHLMGVTDGTVWNKAINAVEDSITGPGADEATIKGNLSTLNSSLNKLNAFSATTPAGQLLRSIGVASAVASLYGSSSKLSAAMQTTNTQAQAFYGVQTFVNVAGLAQKTSELAVGFGLKGPTEGVAAKIFSTFASRTGSGLYNLAGGALDLIDSARSATGLLGGTQDAGNAALSLASGTGGILYGTSQLADTDLLAGIGLDAGGSTLGLVGIGLVAAATVGKLVYEQVKAAHEYEGSSKAFLQAGGYSPTAANALSGQDGLLSGASGSSGLPFLDKYAQMKHMSPAQLQSWVNSLSPDQVKLLSANLLQTAGDSKGNTSAFTDGPPQTATITDFSSGYSTVLTLNNTLGVFEGNLKHDHVPLPP